MSRTPARRTAFAAGALTLAAGLLLATVGERAPAQSVPAAGPPPQRVYVMVLDGLRPRDVNPDLMPNLYELKNESTWYEQARSVFVAETLPNHAAMMTGVFPSRNGIVGNRYERRNLTGGFFEDREMRDPRLLETDTLSTRLERSCGPSISTATVLSKDYLYDLFKGENDAGDPNRQLEADFHWDPRESAFVPISNHTLDAATMNTFVPWARSAPTPQFAFVNLGDIDRSQHADEGGDNGPLGTASMRDTDLLVGQFVDELKTQGWWNETALILASDHGMDWSLPDRFIDTRDVLLDAGYQPDKQFRIGNNGGADMVYLFESDPEKRAGMIETIKAIPGVEFVLTDRTGLSEEQRQKELPRSLYGLNHRYAGDVVALARPGWRFNHPTGSNHIPGNHGHAVTQHSTLLVTGGHPSLATAGPGAVASQSIPGPAIYPSATGTPPQPDGGPGSLSVTPTVAGLLGLPGIPGGYDGPPLSEAFDAGALDGGTAICADLGAEATAPPPTAAESEEPLLAVGLDVASASAKQTTYEIVVSNDGSVPATGVRVTDTVPQRTTFASSDPAPAPPSGGGAPSCDNGGQAEAAGVVCEWALGDIPPGGSATVRATFELPDPITQFSVVETVDNTATATADSGPSVSDRDTSLSILETDSFFIDDTHVDRGEPAGTNHGACDVLRVQRDDATTPQDETTTAFVRTFNEDLEWVYIRSRAGRIERLWAGELRATIATPPAAPTTIGAREVTGDWVGGTGSCEGAQGTADEPRTGLLPAAATTPTASADAPAQPGAHVTWDVTNDLDTPAERAANKGWELVDEGSVFAPEGGSTLLRASDAIPNQSSPRVRLVFTSGEPPTCVDADPDSSAAASPTDAVVKARLTDGDKITNSAGDDACTGTPTPGERVEWEIEDDSPDAHIASRGDSPRASGPNLAIRSTDPTGATAVRVRLTDPDGALGETRVAARVEDAPNPESCSQAPCPTESATEDDASTAWHVPSYPRPKSATPVKVTLVPAYRACAAPNRVHGPPLAFDSCAPPEQVSRQLTVGTPDANRRPPVSTGTVRLATVAGDTATPEDEADVQVSLSLTDVRQSAGLSDYAGEVTIALPVRLTDRDGPATTADFPFEVPADCAATTGTEGSRCSAATTFDALAPGAVNEGARAIWQLGAVEVRDGAGDVFARQGVFVP